jgi:hypothetical protein
MVVDIRLSSRAECTTSVLLDHKGQPIEGKRAGDAEGLHYEASTSTYWISFEQHHRIIPFSRTEGGALKAQSTSITSADFAGLPRNRGLEALVRTAQGHLIAGAEDVSLSEGSHRLWKQNETGWTNFALESRPGYGLVGMDALDDGTIIALTRFYAPGIGNRNEIRLIRPDAFSGLDGVKIKSDLIAELNAQNIPAIDNFEGIAAWRDPDDSLRFWLVADNNFSDSQRSLLAEFVYRPAG